MPSRVSGDTRRPVDVLGFQDLGERPPDHDGRRRTRVRERRDGIMRGLSVSRPTGARQDVGTWRRRIGGRRTASAGGFEMPAHQCIGTHTTLTCQIRGSTASNREAVAGLDHDMAAMVPSRSALNARSPSSSPRPRPAPRPTFTAWPGCHQQFAEQPRHGAEHLLAAAWPATVFSGISRAASSASRMPCRREHRGEASAMRQEGAVQAPGSTCAAMVSPADRAVPDRPRPGRHALVTRRRSPWSSKAIRTVVPSSVRQRRRRRNPCPPTVTSRSAASKTDGRATGIWPDDAAPPGVELADRSHGRQRWRRCAALPSPFGIGIGETRLRTRRR